jgi:hypothetical protein
MFWKRREVFKSMGAFIWGSLFGSAPARAEETQEPALQLAPQTGAHPWADDETIFESYDVVVVGGGIAGFSAAVSAARNGAKVALVHERAMLGGNSSSEVKLYPENATAHQVWIKECGIFDEIHVEERVRNHSPYREGTMNCVWDLTLYEWALREPNLTLFLNTHMHRVRMADPSTIESIYCIQLGSERTFVFSAPIFIDTTGDGVLAHRAGAETRWGREARSQYGEPLAPEQADEKTMGSTLFFRAWDIGRPVPFKRPFYAVELKSEDEFRGRNHSHIEGGYWWIEVGYPYHPIHDNNAIIHEGLRHLLGVWDHIKNHGDHGAENYGLEFVGTWPYKRECRRIVGDYVLTQQHVQDPQPLEDDVAFGDWFVDIHNFSILDRSEPPLPGMREDANWDGHSTRPYGIPLRSLYSRNVHNLLMAGRPISGSYVAFSSTRVLCTGSVVGQAAGTAAALCVKHKTTPRTVAKDRIKECQQLILRQDGYIPGLANEDPADLARQAKTSASSEAVLEFPPGTEEEELRLPTAQIFPVSGDRIDRVELLLRSTLDRDAELHLALRPAAHVWDFRGEKDLTSARGVVRANTEGWVPFELGAKVDLEGLYYIHLPAQPGVFWKIFTEGDDNFEHRCPVGVTPAELPGKKYWRPLRNGRSFCMRLSPESRPFAARNVNQGANRPDRWTNLWMSDPAEKLPASLTLAWEKPIRFNCVEIVFDTNMNRRVRLPFYRYPECVKEYSLEIANGGAWETVAAESDNYMRRRVHRFGTVTSDRLRMNVLGVNGVPNARVYEVRVYEEAARDSA